MKKKTFVVIGLGRFGSNVAKTLSKMNCDVLAIDINEESVSQISNEVSHCVIADASKLNVLEELGVSQIDHAVVAIGNNLQASILTIINLKKLGVEKITVRADQESHNDVFKILGATNVIIPEEDCAISLANQIVSNNILDYYELSNDYAIVQLEVGENFKSATLIDLNIRNNYDVNIVGIIDEKNGFYIPKGTDSINPNDVVVVVGRKNKIMKFELFINK